MTGASGAREVGTGLDKSWDIWSGASGGRVLEYGGGGEEGTSSDVDGRCMKAEGGVGRGRCLAESWSSEYLPSSVCILCWGKRQEIQPMKGDL